jgi:hypothetical protein
VSTAEQADLLGAKCHEPHRERVPSFRDHARDFEHRGSTRSIVVSTRAGSHGVIVAADDDRPRAAAAARHHVSGDSLAVVCIDSQANYHSSRPGERGQPFPLFLRERDRRHRAPFAKVAGEVARLIVVNNDRLRSGRC